MSLPRFVPILLNKSLHLAAAQNRPRLSVDPAWLLLGLSAGLAVATAFLVVTGNWQLMLGLLAALPAFVLLHRYPFFAVILWLAMSPFLATTQTMAERQVYWMIHRALPPATVGVVVLSTLVGLNPRKWPRLGWPEAAMAGYLVVSLYSILTLNFDPLATTYHLYDRVFSPMCLYLVVRLSGAGARDLQLLMPVVFFLGVSQSVIGIVSWLAPGVLPSTWREMVGQRTTGSLTNPATYTTALVFASFLLLQTALSRKPGLVRTLYLAAFVLTSFCVFLSFSRGSWLGGALAALGLIYLYPKFMARLGLVVVVVMLIGGGFLLTHFDWAMDWAGQRLYSEQSEESALSRLPIFLAAYRMFEAKPLWGWGYGNFDFYDRQFQGRVADLVNAAKDHASHNSYLTLLAEQGIIGFSLFLAPVLWWLGLTFRALPRMPTEEFWGRRLLLIFWLILLNQIVVNNFHNNKVVFALGLWWATLGLIANLAEAYLTPGEAQASA